MPSLLTLVPWTWHASGFTSPFYHARTLSEGNTQRPGWAIIKDGVCLHLEFLASHNGKKIHFCRLWAIQSKVFCYNNPNRLDCLCFSFAFIDGIMVAHVKYLAHDQVTSRRGYLGSSPCVWFGTCRTMVLSGPWEPLVHVSPYTNTWSELQALLTAFATPCIQWSFSSISPSPSPSWPHDSLHRHLVFPPYCT